jgi:hypothetical protein
MPRTLNVLRAARSIDLVAPLGFVVGPPNLGATLLDLRRLNGRRRPDRQNRRSTPRDQYHPRYIPPCLGEALNRSSGPSLHQSGSATARVFLFAGRHDPQRAVRRPLHPNAFATSHGARSQTSCSSRAASKESSCWGFVAPEGTRYRVSDSGYRGQMKPYVAILVAALSVPTRPARITSAICQAIDVSVDQSFFRAENRPTAAPVHPSRSRAVTPPLL